MKHNQEIRGGSPIKTLDELREMTAQERLELFRGLIPDYNIRVSGAIEFALPSLKDKDLSDKERIEKAFQMRVENHLAAPGDSFGGSALDHLPQRGYISQEEYEKLNLTAIALAATIMSEMGYSDYASSAFKKLGKLSAKNYIPLTCL